MLWALLLCGVLLLAAYVGFGRLAMAHLNDYRQPLLTYLNRHVPFTVTAVSVDGHWRSFSPEVTLRGLELAFPEVDGPPLRLTQGVVGVNVLRSLFTGSLVLNRLAVEDLHLRSELAEDGRFTLLGFGSSSEGDGQWLQRLLLAVEDVELHENTLLVTLPDGSLREFQLDLQLQRRGARRHIDASLRSTVGTVLDILAAGVGDPLQPGSFTGNVYLQFDTPDVGALHMLMGKESPAFWASGAAAAEVWLGLSGDQRTVEARISGQDIEVYSADDEIRIPLQSFSMDALWSQQDERWTLFGQDLQIQHQGTPLALDRLQLEGWGEALRLSLKDVDLAPIGQVIASLDIVPEHLRDIATALALRGEVPALRIAIGDAYKPLDDWEIEANFEALGVSSWRGSPGVEGARGYARLKPGGGSLILDSQPIALDFPSIYHQPLQFESVNGTVNVHWDAYQLALSSGLLQAAGEEGDARVLFGLQIPLQPDEYGIGTSGGDAVSMELLVGLQDSGTQFREKYIPFTLAGSLRRWLQRSIGDGAINAGGFLWRGSLARDGAPDRSVQLAFNLADTPLSYHQDWPAVQVERGVVLIDDAAVSVWSDRAQLYDSQVESLSVEILPDANKEPQLAVTGHLSGAASDGLKIVNHSVLSKMVGHAFKRWKAAGDLQVDLDLRLNLAKPASPSRIRVNTQWSDTRLEITPGNIALDAVSGEVSYRSGEGFRASGLQGRLWGEPVAVAIEQSPRAGGATSSTRLGDLVIKLDTQVAMQSLQAWLQLDLLAFASGKTPAQLVVAMADGATPQLSVFSQLHGVSLDLPRPFHKGAQETAQFSALLPLRTGAPLSLHLDDQLHLDLALSEASPASGLDRSEGSRRAGLLGASLGVNAPSPALEEGLFRVGGHLNVLHGDDWPPFLETYLGVRGWPAPAEREADIAATRSSDVNRDLRLAIEDFSVDAMALGSVHLEGLEASLHQRASGDWSLAMDSDWLRGQLELRAGDVSRARLDLLDVAAFMGEQTGEAQHPAASTKSVLDSSGESRILHLPAIDVSVAALRRGDQPLGTLDFALRSDGPVIQLRNIRGELAGMQLTADEPALLQWQQGEGAHSKLVGQFAFDDLGRSLEVLGYQRIVKNNGGNLDVTLNWPGNPQDFALARAQGSIRLTMAEGSFLEAPSGAAGALRVVNILNLADIVRRLSLSHMFDSGITFDKVAGEIYLHGGTLEVARMDVEGPSSFRFSGVSDVVAQDLNGELVATLPVANNLPWMAALAASLPVAAGVYVVSKVFDKQMQRLSSAVYTIEGSWDEPLVEFDRIFDDTPREQALPLESLPGQPTGQEPVADSGSLEPADAATVAQ